jgi:hypothetical protein
MSRLSEAQDRFEAALERLERASGERTRSAGESGSARAAEFEIVSARCDALENKARVVSERLDVAIGRVRALLES